MRRPTRLVEYPWVVVRIECVLCPRRGAYRLARLARRYGPEQSLDGLLADLAHDCPWWRSNPRRYEPRCGARFVDLERNLPPPDDPHDPIHRQRGPDRESMAKRRPTTSGDVGEVPMLSGWPLPTITIHCRRCGRLDVFVVADILATSGDARLTDLRRQLTTDCPRAGAESIYEQCGAMFDVPP